MRSVVVPARPLTAFRPLIGEDRYIHLEHAAEEARELLGDRVIWNVNSTASGGGVAEMLLVLVGYIRGAGLDGRWLVMNGDPEFFAITKRVHNRIHGAPGDDGDLGPAAARHYAEVTAANAAALAEVVRRKDVVLLHDPQTAGMVGPLVAAGVTVIWRCHIGADFTNPCTEEAWQFLRPNLDGCNGFVFSCESYVPPWLPRDRVAVIAPSIDPFSPKNQDIAASDLPRFLQRIGLVPGPDRGPAWFARLDGSRGEVTRPASIISDGPPLREGSPLVVQVSRWDRLKDMGGVMSAFASEVVGRVNATLALVGPEVEGVADDPEGAEVFAACRAAWHDLPDEARRRVKLVSLPMDDVDANAAMVNAIQRAATIIVQKSLVEGFGLTVAEGMWKAKPVVASRVGGIIDQVVPGTGILLDDPADLGTFGDVLAGLLERPDDIARLGEGARRHVLEAFVGDRHLLQYAELMRRLLPA